MRAPKFVMKIMWIFHMKKWFSIKNVWVVLTFPIYSIRIFVLWLNQLTELLCHIGFDSSKMSVLFIFFRHNLIRLQRKVHHAIVEEPNSENHSYSISYIYIHALFGHKCKLNSALTYNLVVVAFNFAFHLEKPKTKDQFHHSMKRNEEYTRRFWLHVGLLQFRETIQIW